MSELYRQVLDKSFQRNTVSRLNELQDKCRVVHHNGPFRIITFNYDLLTKSEYDFCINFKKYVK